MLKETDYNYAYFERIDQKIQDIFSCSKNYYADKNKKQFID